MSQVTVRALLDQLRQLDESDRVEAKRASAIGESLLDTVCAFANEPGLGGGWRLLGSLGDESKNYPFSALSQESEGLSARALTQGYSLNEHSLKAYLHSLRAYLHSLKSLSRESLLAELPESLQQRIASMGQRSRDTSRIESIILELCTLRPCSLQELARVTGRNRHYLRHRYLKPLLKDGRLRRKYPDEPNRPDQAYITAKEQE